MTSSPTESRRLAVVALTAAMVVLGGCERRDVPPTPSTQPAATPTSPATPAAPMPSASPASQ